MFEGRFSQLRTVGAGAMGKVYKAWDEGAGRHVALKILEAKDTSKRFAREARVLSQLVHPNIVSYIAHGVTREGQPWLAMEWLEGSDLEARLRTARTLSLENTLRVARAVASGLAWAHERGYVHRDLKPSNVFVVGPDYTDVKIVDFGLARGELVDAPITKTGTFMGTIEYMPPEQVNDAKRADARADVYSLGAVLFHCMTGRAPHHGTSVVDTMRRTLTEEAPLMSTLRRDAPPDFEALVASMLKKEKEQRPLDGGAVFAAINALGRPIHPSFAELDAVDVEAPTVMVEAPPGARPPSFSPPSSNRGAPPQVNVSPKTGTVIIPVQSLPPLEQVAARDRPKGERTGWLGVALLSMVILIALFVAGWRWLYG